MNSRVTRFITKAVAVFLVWYVVYELWLLPDGTLDKWLSLNIIGISAGILNGLNVDVYTVNRIIGIEGFGGIEVVDGCNGISAMGLFLGFMVAYPGKWKPKLSFMLMGIGVIYLVNIFRIIALVITQAQWPSIFHFTHDYSTTGIFYLIIFVLWMVWIQLSEKESEPLLMRPIAS